MGLSLAFDSANWFKSPSCSSTTFQNKVKELKKKMIFRKELNYAEGEIRTPVARENWRYWGGINGNDNNW